MRISTLFFALVLIWAVSAVLCAWLAARKARGVRRWALLGVVLGPLGLLAHAFYPARYVGDTVPCPRCGKPVGVRAVACLHCQYRFPSMDVLITRVPDDPRALQSLLGEVAREYGITYEEARRKLGELPVAGYRHVLPDQVGEYVRRLETVGAGVTVVPSSPPPPSP